MEVEERATSAQWRWSLLFSVIILNICLPSLILSFGTILVHAVSYGQPVWLGICTPVVFFLTYCLTQCWCRDAADSWGGTAGYRLMASFGLLLIVTSLVACAFVPYHVQPFVYGCLGGFGSSLISAQVDAVVFESYDTRLRTVRGLCLLGQAIGQSLFPHIITILVDYYGYSMFYILLSAIMLQTLPTILSLKMYETVRRPVSYSRYGDLAKSYAIFQNDTVSSYYTNELQLNDLSKNWKSPDHSTEEEEDIEDDCNNINTASVTPPPSPEEKRRNIFGVEILPEIPEESEDSDECDSLNTNYVNKHKRRLSNAIKRLSTLGDNFDEYIIKQSRKDSKTDLNYNREFSDLDVTNDNITPITDIRTEQIFNSLNFRCQSFFVHIKRKFWMPSYKVYRIRRRLNYSIYILNDTFVKPLSRSLSCWRFYPVLFLSVSRLIIMAVVYGILPLINLEMEPKISMTETNFMMSILGFTWISFMLTTPWLAQTSKTNFKYLVVGGMFLCTSACYLIAEAKNHDTYSIGCVVAGLGFGALSSSWEPAAQEFVGIRKWPKVHSTLETLSGLCVAAYALALILVIDLEEESGLQFCIQVLRDNEFNPNTMIRRAGEESAAEGGGGGSGGGGSESGACAHIARWSSHRVMQWLNEIDLAEYAPNLRGAGVHGGLMLLEPRFTAELLAALLNIPAHKTLLRRHLTQRFNDLLGRDVIQQKRNAEQTLGYQPLTTTTKYKVPKKSQFSLKRKKSKDGTDFGELVCPLTDDCSGDNCTPTMKANLVSDVASAVSLPRDVTERAH